MNLIICGINGKMGKCLYETSKDRGISVVCGIDKTICGDFDCPIYKSFDEIKEFADVIIDFSSPETLTPMLDYAALNLTPLVICTTGHSAEQEAKIKEYSKIIPIFKASNTSAGINLLIKICRILAEDLKEHDIEILDYHHSKKIDAPSGTSYSILEAITSVRKDCYPVFGRKGEGKRNKNEICVHSVRGGNIVGEHEVFFFGENDCVSIKHIGYSKVLFAEGAIKAAEFIIGKNAGLYGMDDINL